MVEITVTHADGSTDTIDETLGWERKRVVGEMRRVIIDVERSKAEAANLEPKSDSIGLGSIDTVRLVDIESGGSVWSLVCYAFEWDANAVAPTGGGDLRTGDDQALINGLVGEVPSWSAGTVNSFTGSLNFVLNHAHRHEAIRRIERNVPGEIQFRDSGTVDYVDRLGSDKTGSVTLSAANANIERRIRITNRGRELDGTHIRVLGAHEGEAQYFANLVPAADTASQSSLENVVTYTTSRWSDSSDTDWDRWENKDVADQDTIEEEAAAIAEEIKADLVEVETTVPNSLGLAVGDTVHVEKPKADLDRDMRVHRITTKAGGRNDTESAASVVDELLLSTRTTVRKGDAQDLEDIQRFNTAFQGSAVWGTPSGGIQAVDSGLNYQLSFFYPDVSFEHTAELQVKSIPYRAYSSGADNISEDITAIELADSDNNVLLTAGSEDTISNSVDANFLGDEMIFTVTLDIHDSGFTEQGPVPVAVEMDTPTQTLYRGEISLDALGTWAETVTTTEIDANESFELQIRNNDDVSLQYDYNITGYGPEHRHAVNPGVTEFSSETATGCDVLVNGSTVATNIGSGSFEEVVDIAGDLTKGAWNTVEVTSDTLGLLICTGALTAYRQIGTN